MSFSTDAFLYFGFDFWDAEDGTGQEGPISGPHEGHMWEENDPVAHIEKHYGKIPSHITVSNHCMSLMPIWYVCISESFKIASRGFSAKLTAEELVEKPNWKIELEVFCKKVGLEWQEPSWVLASRCDDFR